MVTVRDLAHEAERVGDSTRLRDLAVHRSKAVRSAVARNPATDDDTVARLLRDADEVVRLAAACNLADRPALQRSAAESAEEWIRANLASTFRWQKDRSLPYDLQAALARDSFFETRLRVAETTNYLDLFETLIGDDDPKVRAACAANPRISKAQMEVLVTDRRATVRAYAAAAGILYPDDEQLLRLARDRAANVRWAVIFWVDRPREALEVIAEDSDEINRRHAHAALSNNLNVMSAQFEETVRAERREATNVGPFLKARQ